jgi:flavin reductase (DIM6/NTAB) family NADH-FMN oxidoreductase RutF
MMFLNKILTRFNGLHFPQEYMCLPKESFIHPLHAFLSVSEHKWHDITERHVFTGYKPLIFSFPSSAAFLENAWPDEIKIRFYPSPAKPNEFPGKKDAIAQLSMKLFHKQQLSGLVVCHYEGLLGSHCMLAPFHQNVISLYNRLFNKKPGNVYLPGNLYKQVQIAYALPRIISLITVSRDGLFNLFPTDLHGPLNDAYYISSLRYDGKAARQVKHAGRIVISHMHAGSFKTVYDLGKNHMQEMKPASDLPFGNEYSESFQLPLPQGVLNYFELEIADTFTRGIHRLFLYKIINRKILNQEPATLAHIHNVYATWRFHHTYRDHFLIR